MNPLFFVLEEQDDERGAFAMDSFYLLEAFPFKHIGAIFEGTLEFEYL